VRDSNYVRSSLISVLAAIAVAGVLAGAQEAPAASSNRALQFREISIPTDKGPKFVAVADVNHDGKPDILVANDSGTITVLLGDGRGNFHEARGSPVPAGHLPNDIAVADMNGDGNPDLVIANHQSPYLTILLGDGKGGFRPASGSPFDVHSHPHPHGVAVGAFSDKGKLDVVTDSWGNNQIELLEGDGKGGLRLPGRYFRVGRRPYERLRSADFNHDGNPDVVTTNLDDDTVTILLGDGKGGFREAQGSPFPAGAKPWQVAIDDFNKDGNTDLAIIPYERDVTDASRVVVTILLGDGKGGFKPMQTQSLSLDGCHGPSSVATGDINGDGYRDIVVWCAESKNMAIFMGSRANVFTRFTHAAAGGWGSVAVADLNGDGRDDIVTANNNDGNVTVYLSE
jgi:hypothetical protein